MLLRLSSAPPGLSMVKASDKGGSFERLVCEKLSRWVLPASDRTLFWRSSMSGGRVTVRRGRGKADADQSSDLCAVAPEGNALCSVFTIECKHYKTLNLPSAFINGTQELPTFWRQVSREAAYVGKRPFLIARQNSWPILALVRTGDLAFFGHVEDVLQLERARLFRLSSRRSSISMFTLDDILSLPYNGDCFNVRPSQTSE